ncbi:MAG: squalene/phytoene synthase family protein [Wenzhouxiangella sp.]
MEPLDWCRERLLVPGNPLSASLLFLTSEQRDRVLAIRSLQAEIAAMASPDSPPETLQPRLQWWRSAILDGDNSHPVIRALGELGLRSPPLTASLDELVEAVLLASSAPRFERLEDLRKFCFHCGGAASQMEARVLAASQSADTPVDVGDWLGLGAAAYLLRLLRDLSIDARHQRWFVPLDLQADFQITRTEVADRQHSRRFDGLVRTLVAEAFKWAEACVEAKTPLERQQQSHLMIQWALDQRLGRVMARKPARLLSERVLPSHAGNVWIAWRAARRLS